MKNYVIDELKMARDLYLSSLTELENTDLSVSQKKEVHEVITTTLAHESITLESVSRLQIQSS
jgi:hypothetical protein